MSDPRFARLKTDPRFRRPRKKQTKVVIDDRFKSVFAPQHSTQKLGRVDKYGRSIQQDHEADSLKRFYRLENDRTDHEPPHFLDYARGEVLLESSDDDDDDQDPVENSEHSSDDLGYESSRPIAVTQDPHTEIDLDETDLADLDAQAIAYTKANPDVNVEEGAPTCRLAAVNLDWDHVRAIHLFKICSSLVSSTAPHPDKQSSTKGVSGGVSPGKVLAVRIYPSEFGSKRMAREETEGPPPEIFKRKEYDDEINTQNIYQVGGEDDYDRDALRKYQLERLRYYYAIIICDTVAAAAHIYNELEGTELERSANVFDLSYVPDDMTFINEIRDEATDDANFSSKGVDFVTDALRHSNVKLTWDEDDAERNQLTRRKLTKKEIEDADFKAYLASSSSESESEVFQVIGKNQTYKEVSRDKLRALLLGGDRDMPEGWGGDNSDAETVDMEITFTPGLSEQKDDETTIGKYQRKIREKRKRRKEETNEKAHGPKADLMDANDNFFEAESRKEGRSAKGGAKGNHSGEPHSSSAVSRTLSTPEELALLVTSDSPATQSHHFDMKSVLKADKRARQKRGRRMRSNDGNDNELQMDFKIDVNDDRFKVLHEDHQFAIDPTNPRFKKTKSMDAFLQERSRRQELIDKSHLSLSRRPEDATLDALVARVKRKSIDVTTACAGKRRRV